MINDPTMVVAEARPRGCFVSGEGIRDNADQHGKSRITVISEEAWLATVEDLAAVGTSTDVRPASRRAALLAL